MRRKIDPSEGMAIDGRRNLLGLSRLHWHGRAASRQVGSVGRQQGLCKGIYHSEGSVCWLTTNQHWATWFTSKDVSTLKSLKLNAVRIPLGFWIVESIVNKRETFPQGGLAYLRSGAKLLQKAGMGIVLDLHALPGAQTPNQAFVGQCAGKANFYTTSNFQRGLQVSAALAALAHTDPAFTTAFSLAAINEPAQDQSTTPGLLKYYQDFSKTVRATEKWLGMSCGAKSSLDKSTITFLQAFLKSQGLKTTKPPIVGYSKCLTLTFQDPTWQHNPATSNPAKATIGPTLYDDHAYFSFGGVTKPTYNATMSYVCSKRG
jgi:hypothetical protein